MRHQIGVCACVIRARACALHCLCGGANRGCPTQRRVLYNSSSCVRVLVPGFLCLPCVMIEFGLDAACVSVFEGRFAPVRAAAKNSYTL